MRLSTIFRSRLRLWLLAAIVVLVSLALVGQMTRGYWLPRLIYHRSLRYNVPFEGSIAKADKIVVRDGGFDCCGTVDKDKVLFVLTDPVEVRQVASHFQFQALVTTNSIQESCMCCGSPGIDWYHGSKRIALTAVQHGKKIRWRGFSTARILGVQIGYGDGPLTKEAADWVVEWLDKHGVTDPKKEVEEQRRRIEERARQPKKQTTANEALHSTLEPARSGWTPFYNWQKDVFAQKQHFAPGNAGFRPSVCCCSAARRA